MWVIADGKWQEKWKNEMKVVTLGPEGTFSHQVTEKLFPKGKVTFASSLDEVFFLLGDPEADQAVVPIENTVSGFVEETITNLMKYDFSIQGRYEQKITYYLAGWGKPEEAKILYAQPHAYRQCQETLKKSCPEVKLIETLSNAHSALQLKAKKDDQEVALVTPFALEHYGLTALQDHVEDDPDNTTTFYVLGKEPLSPSGHDQTTFLIFSDPLAAVENQIQSLIAEKKVKLIKLKNPLIAMTVQFISRYLNFCYNNH